MRNPVLVLALITAFGAGLSSVATAGEMVDVYKSPNCDCCGKWIDHLKDAGFEVRAHNVMDGAAPGSNWGCQTASVPAIPPRWPAMWSKATCRLPTSSVCSRKNRKPSASRCPRCPPVRQAWKVRNPFPTTRCWSSPAVKPAFLQNIDPNRRNP